MKTIKLLAFTLIAATTFSVAACKKDDSANDSLKPYGTIDDVSETKVEGTLHNVSIKETETVFVKDKSTEYKVVVGESADAAKAGAFLASHVYKATGAQIAVVKESEVSWNEQNKNIYVGCKNLFAEAGLTMPSEDLRESGYYIKSKGDSVFIATNFNAGYQTGALAFLRATIGYDMLSADCVVYEKDGATMPDIEIIERPDFDFRHYSQPLTSDGLYGMGFSSGDGMISIDGRTSHTSFSWLPPSKYSHDYSEWYADNGQQLCYTAHGDSERFEQMVDTITKNITKRLDEYPDINTVSISQQDTADYCTCWKCREVLDKYGTMNGTIIPFLNRVSDEIQAYYKSKAEDTGEEERQITVISFAYQYTSDPPVKRNANGKWEPIDDTVVMRDNVGIYIAPLEAKYNQTFYDEANRGFYDNITRWGLITKHVYFWLYETNFCAYMYPYNTWDTMIEQYRFIAQYGQNYIFNEGQLGQYGTTAFTRFKDYIDSKAQFDVNVDYRTLSLLDGGDEMAQIVGDKLIALISADEAGNNFKSYYQFSAPDIRGWSNSESSQAAKTKYGAYSAEYILFMNKLAKYLDTHGGFTRKIDLVLLAYNMSLEAPSKNLSELNFYQGEKSSLAVMFAPIEKNSYRALNDETVGVKYGYSNKYFLDQLQKWNLFGGEIMFWNYSEYYDNYFVPLDTLTNMQATYKAIASAGVTHLQDEGAISDYVGTDWTALKIYIKSKLAEDVNCNVEALIERFCNVYYGAGAEYMLNLLKSEQTRYKIISDTSVSDNGGKDAIGAHVVRESMAKKKYWAESEFDEWYGYIKAAVAAVEASDLSDSDREEVIKRIEMEGVAVRYMKYYIFDKYVTLQDDSKDSIEKIKSTCVDVGITRFADGAAYIRKNRLLNTWQLVDGAIENLG